ncbi:LytTR family DNA-binding domain-containing protein [Danxiaibacter flavus]|jgi:DNA-binding LytR/AlgR family response regulator|uniref:LytTR family DNA-binding domain-containing protein n=1 Tax=Danxiaibacter flavus TaxID=3049108 RepID=A0ABV3ZMP7_9BACT|nr:LytTR family DNA-binding domain-containing protein [Chitinophagaceae bacterium DXS]
MISTNYFSDTQDMPLQQTGYRRNFILIKSEYKLIKAWLDEIQYISAMKDYTQVFIAGKSTPITTLQNLKDFESKLPEADFIRVHRSFIIALHHIDCISRNEIGIGKHTIPIGDAYRDELKKKIAPYL